MPWIDATEAEPVYIDSVVRIFFHSSLNMSVFDDLTRGSLST